jgi:hypothetical protein
MFVLVWLVAMVIAAGAVCACETDTEHPGPRI